MAERPLKWGALVRPSSTTGIPGEMEGICHGVVQGFSVASGPPPPATGLVLSTSPGTAGPPAPVWGWVLRKLAPGVGTALCKLELFSIHGWERTTFSSTNPTPSTWKKEPADGVAFFRSGKVVLQEFDCQLSYLHFLAGKLLSKINQNPSTKPSLRRHGVPDLLVPCSCHRAARRRTSLLHPPRPRAPHLLHLSEGRRANLLGKHHWHQRLVEVSLESHDVSGHIHLLNWTPSLLIKAGMLSLNNHFLR